MTAEEEISAGMKIFDIKPDYYVDDNYLFYSYDDESEDELSEDFEDDEED